MCPPSGSVEFLKHLDGAAVLWVQLKRFLIVGDGLRLVAVVHVSLAEAVVDIARLRIDFDVELQNADRFLEFIGMNKSIA